MKTDENENNNTSTTDIEKSNESSVTENQKKQQKIYKFYKVVLLIFTALFMHIFYGLELTAGSMILTYAAESNLKLSKSEGAQLASLFWGVFTGWRLITIFYIEYIGSELNIAFSLRKRSPDSLRKFK